MFKNYLKIAFRNMKRYKGYSFINIFGLVLGMVCAIYIMLYVDFELSYDNFHEHSDRTYRIVNEQTTSNGLRYYAGVTSPLGPAVKEKLPQIENMARICRSEPKTVRYGARKYIEEKIVFADPEIFDLFSLKWIKGDFNQILTVPSTAVITEHIAVKYFGDKDPVGQFLEIGGKNLALVGVIADSPQNTHLKFGIIQSYATLTLPDPDRPPHFLDWHTGHGHLTYVRLSPGTDIDLVNSQINQIAYDNLKEKLAQYGYQHHYALQKIQKIHLSSGYRGEVEPSGNPQYLYIFSFIGFFILLIACTNFINLSTACSAKRASEIGIRKVVGAARKQLISQLLGETLLLIIITLVLSIIVVALTMNLFNSIFSTNFEINELYRPKIFLYMLFLGIFAGFASGVYPAFFMSEFNPSVVLKGSFLTGRHGAFSRKCLVIGQIVLSVILITGTLIIYRQIHYMKNNPLGFDKEQKLVITLPDIGLLTNKYETIKSELQEYPSVSGVTASSSVPGKETFFWRLWPTGMRDKKSQPLHFINADYDFIDVYDMEIIAGRSFDLAFGSDQENRGWVINEAAVLAYDWNTPTEAIGKEMLDNGTPIIGVVKNFHYKGLQNEIEPLAISVWSEHFNCLTLDVDLNNIDKTISYAESVIEKFFPGVIFSYFFLDDYFNSQYLFEEQIGFLFGMFTSLGIMIAVLGLFGLTAFIAEQRTKEIGIKKVFGASLIGLVFDFLKDFGKWVIIANLIAWPIAYYAMNKWLQNFAYRTGLSIWIFVLSGLAALVITFLTVGYQSIKAASANPIETLRYE